MPVSFVKVLGSIHPSYPLPYTDFIDLYAMSPDFLVCYRHTAIEVEATINVIMGCKKLPFSGEDRLVIYVNSTHSHCQLVTY